MFVYIFYPFPFFSVHVMRVYRHWKRFAAPLLSLMFTCTDRQREYHYTFLRKHSTNNHHDVMRRELSNYKRHFFSRSCYKRKIIRQSGKRKIAVWHYAWLNRNIVLHFRAAVLKFLFVPKVYFSLWSSLRNKLDVIWSVFSVGWKIYSERIGAFVVE